MPEQQPSSAGNNLAQQERDERLGGETSGRGLAAARRHATSLRLAPAPRTLPQRDGSRPREVLAVCVNDELRERLGE